MDADDKLVAETLEKKNELESLCINMRQKINSDHFDYSSERERDDLSKLADTLEDWLYNEGEDEPKSVYAEKILQMRKISDPILARKKEADCRQEEFQRLQNYSSELVLSLSQERYDHLEVAEKEAITKEVRNVLDDLTSQFNAQQSAPKHEEPTFKARTIISRIQVLRQEFFHFSFFAFKITDFDENSIWRTFQDQS
eukprot:TRINITY_DN5116_c0_g1_i1.p1 TRINITY_DN5116_c0_g1~~TRINITY_DN5116_c0_g1_i1.p1  ORF type:complete len:198 (+),score=35.49 TRINITY_DN5116_c0_g1_i1:549-1142(+)